MTYQLADCCCCAGLAADGYAAIFGASAIHGFDHEPQEHYPYGFTQADVMQLLRTDIFTAWVGADLLAELRRREAAAGIADDLFGGAA